MFMINSNLMASSDTKLNDETSLKYIAAFSTSRHFTSHKDKKKEARHGLKQLCNEKAARQ